MSGGLIKASIMGAGKVLGLGGKAAATGAQAVGKHALKPAAAEANVARKGLLAALRAHPKLAGTLGAGGILSAAYLGFKGLATGGSGHNGAGTGIGPNGYSGPGNVHWFNNPLASLKNPIESTKNTFWAGLDNATGGNIPAISRARARATQTKSNDTGALIARGGFDRTFTDPNIGDVIGGTLSPEEEIMVGMMDPKDRARYLLQKRMQERAEMAALLSQLQALRHQTAMQVINNIR